MSAIRRFSFLTLALIVVCVAHAQIQPLPLPTYVEIKGEKEFSGQMIIRPLQMDDAVRKTGSEAAARQLRASAAARLKGNIVRYAPEVDEYVVKVPRGENETSFSRKLMATGEFQYAQPNWILYPVGTPNDPQYGSQWHHQTMRSWWAWDRVTGSNSIVIAVTDTGCDLTHPDLAASYVPGYNSVDHLAQVNGGNVGPIHPHGTHVAGCAAAIGNNGVGVAGVGWNFKIMPIRVSNSTGGGATYDSLAEGARWAADHGAKVISASYSGIGDPSIETTGAYCRTKGALYLYAAGNNGANLTGFDFANVTIVGATDVGDVRASFSAYGPAVDVFAPGVGILATVPGGGYEAWNGTSMATPLANGLCALIWSANPSLTPEEVETILETSCTDLGAPGNDNEWGWGRIDVYRAIAQTLSRVRYNPATGHYYERVTVPNTWTSSNTAAQARSFYGTAGHLAAINSAAENTWIVNNLEQTFVRSHYLGGFQPAGSSEPAGGWRWSNNDAWSYTNWSPGEPNNAGGEDSLEFFSGGPLGGWNDRAGTSAAEGYIVEYPTAPVAISGTITPLNYVPSVAGLQATIIIRDALGNDVETKNAVLNAGGSYSFTTNVRGPHKFRIKISHWLARLTGTFNVTAGGASGVNAVLTNGDVDGDNEITLVDYGRVSASFGKALGDAGFDPLADLDGDQEVTLVDLGILSGGFGQAGDD